MTPLGRWRHEYAADEAQAFPGKGKLKPRDGKAVGKRDKLSVFYIQLKYIVEKPNNQRLVVGVDPGSHFEGYSVNGERDTVLHIMSEATDGKAIKKKLEVRRNMRRSRRFKKWRREARFKNRNKSDWLHLQPAPVGN